MLNYARLKDMIDSVLSWGQDHDEEFRECLVDALGITAQEYKELFEEDLDEYIYGKDEEDDDDEEEDEEC